MKDRGNFGLENRRVGRKIKGDGVIKIRALKDRISSADTSVGLGSVSINIQLTELPVFRSPAEAVAHHTKERKRGSDSDAVGDCRKVCLVPKVGPEFAVGFPVFSSVSQAVPRKMSKNWVATQSGQGRLL